MDAVTNKLSREPFYYFCRFPDNILTVKLNLKILRIRMQLSLYENGMREQMFSIFFIPFCNKF